MIPLTAPNIHHIASGAITYSDAKASDNPVKGRRPQ
jgi:hypothetical protein